MSDLISRKAVYEMLHGLGGCDASDEWSNGWDKAIDTAISELNEIPTAYEGLSREDAQELGEHFDIALECMQKQLTGGWIPCKDRLPKTGNTIVLTQDKYGHIALAIYKDEKFYYLNQTNTTFIKGSVINGAIAWMPLPEPYREEDKDAEGN